MRVNGAKVIITGAASGIGAALSQALALKGCDLLLIDRNEDALFKVAAQAQQAAPEIRALPLVINLSDPFAAGRVDSRLFELGFEPSILINNAGIALLGDFEQVSPEQFEAVMDVNFHAPVRLCRALLPRLRAQPMASIVNISSAFGLIAPAGQTAYSASKFALRAFSEALGSELQQSSVRVTCVCPGGIKTPIARAAVRGRDLTDADAMGWAKVFDRIARTTPEAAAIRIIRAIERSERRALIGWDAVAVDITQRLAPQLLARWGPALARGLLKKFGQ